MASRLLQGMFRLVVRKNIFTEKLVKPWDGLPRAVAESLCWRDLKELWMRCSRKWFSGGLGSMRLMVALDDLRSLFKPKRFYDSVKLSQLKFHTKNLWRARKMKAQQDPRCQPRSSLVPPLEGWPFKNI